MPSVAVELEPRHVRWWRAAVVIHWYDKNQIFVFTKDSEIRGTRVGENAHVVNVAESAEADHEACMKLEALKNRAFPDHVMSTPPNPPTSDQLVRSSSRSLPPSPQFPAPSLHQIVVFLNIERSQITRAFWPSRKHVSPRAGRSGPIWLAPLTGCKRHCVRVALCKAFTFPGRCCILYVPQKRTIRHIGSEIG